ncbi:PAS domain S-box protein [Natranaerofaba carboxydovora]|uniref:sensor domain-containing diguanylate cyclase/phosphohydrolase n=1 Tax=Natranaerofaba carboxydovora TaxID=2742683 RepID=UPI001F145A96|nr:PAS domain S-box protein [Natranaerofaba carboxydovora]UMZ74358.1 Cyclic di-GMP phosphodiesterase response regulator RpfG [Natranaerofaba carboxydovora]
MFSGHHLDQYGIIIDAFEENICLLNEDGYIEQVNNSWLDFARANNANIDRVKQGVNYIEICNSAAYDDKQYAFKFNEGLLQVIEGRMDNFEMEYPCHSPTKERWFNARVTPYYKVNNKSKNKVIVTHQEITEKKLLEREQTKNLSLLRERIKELNCINELSSLIVQDYSLDEILQKTANLLPMYWQCPEKACSKIEYNGKVFTSEITFESELKLTKRAEVNADINNKTSCEIEILYSEDFEFDGKTSFLEEEKKLLSSVANQLANVITRKENEEELADTKENLYITLSSIGDGVISTDSNGAISFMNPQAERLTGWPLDKAVGKPLKEVFNIVNSKTDEPVNNPVNTVLKTGKRKDLANHTALISSSGDRYQIADSASPIIDKKGKIKGVVLVFADVTEKYEKQELLRKREEKYRALVNQSSEMLFLHDLQGNILEVNNKTVKVTGYTEEELLKMRVFDLHPHGEENTPEIIINRWSEMKAEDKPLTLETKHKHKDGSLCPVEVTTNKVIIGEDYYMLALVRDITERKEREEKLRHMSLHDSLTGLYNRAYMEEEIRRYEKERDLPVSIVMIDINGLRLINENYSYETGDELLIEVGKTLKRVCGEKYVIGRWGSDEFVVLMPGADYNKAEKIISTVEKECKNININTKLPVKIAFGIATKIDSEENLKDILRQTEDDLYKNKLMETESARSDVIWALSGILKEKSDETEEHALRMKNIGLDFGKVLGLSDTEMNKLSLLAAMHDIGKVAISEDILKKPGKLTEEEWQIIKEHPLRGYRIAQSSNSLIHIAEEILSHHERFDGKGYPRGLKEKEIPYLARVIAIIDTYDVITNGRAYKSPESKKEALEEIKRCSGGQFDPDLVEEFIKLMKI